MPRVALFLDFENLYNALKKQHANYRNPYGESPRMDFEQLVEYVNENYGKLAPRDFIVVANFTHYNPQLGGLNRLATVIDAQSFHTRAARREKFGRGKGRKFVIEQYADMRLAFEIGKHVATNPADIYIIGSGDKAFVAVGRALENEGYQVVFLVAGADSESVAYEIKAEFDLLDFTITQKAKPQKPHIPKTKQKKQKPESDGQDVAALVGQLRRELTTAIPLALAEALIGPQEQAQKALRAAQSKGKVDVWENNSGITCISLRSERLFGKVQIMESRPEVVWAAKVLKAVRSIAEKGAPYDRPSWRRALKEHLGISNRESKELLQQLLELGILKDGALDKPSITIETAKALMEKRR